MQAAAGEVIAAFSDSDWGRGLGDLCGRVTGGGASHRGGVELVRLLPEGSDRAELLRSHAAAHLLAHLLLPKATPFSRASRTDAGP